MKTLVLTEKPSVAREIARVLGCNKNANGGIIGDKYIVTWALGHLVTLAMPEDINKEWKTWNESHLPMIPNKFETKVIGSTSKQFNNVKAFMKDPSVEKLVIATDAGREGELVARWIINKIGFKKPMMRLWISSMTDSAIKQGFKNLKDAKEYYRLYEAALARAEADWLVGLNISRALTCKYNASLSAGRVQTPTLSLITQREEEIKNFIPKTYYLISLKVKNNDFILIKNNNPHHIFNKDECLQIINSIKKSTLKVIDIKNTNKSEFPPLLYDLTSLQQDANKLYGFSAKHTLDLVQSLYEVHKILTYPRTDSKYLSTDMYNTIKDRIKNSSYGEFGKYANVIINGNINNSKRIFDNSKVSDHHAIIPTELRPNINNLETDEKRIYDLVIKRFLAAFLPNYDYLSSTVIIGSDEYTLKANGVKIIKDGWKELYKNSTLIEEEGMISSFTKGEIVDSKNVNYKEAKTTPPDRYTEATLLYAMEHAGKYVENQEEKQALQDSSGIGTPATRAEIIERIFSAGYVKLVGRSIHPTEKGMQLVSLVPEKLKSVSLTARQELKLNLISKGKLKKEGFILEIIDFTKKQTSEVLNSTSKYHHDNLSTSKCPTCGKKLLDVTNKYGKSLCCMDKECGYKKNIYKISKLRCPNCHRFLKQIGEKEKAFFGCDCGFKEKCEKFFSNLKENNQGMNKKELRKVLEKQDKEIPTNNPFADLFKK